MKPVLAVMLAFVLLVLWSGSVFALCIKTGGANLRKGPGTRYAKIGEAFKYTPVKRVAKKGNWYKVRNVDGRVFWIHRNLVTGHYRCAVVKVSEAHVRKGPGTKYREINYSPSIKYETFKVEKRKGSWIKIRDEFDGTGWIFRKLLWIQ